MGMDRPIGWGRGREAQQGDVSGQSFLYERLDPGVDVPWG